MINVTTASSQHTATDLLNLSPEQTALEVKDLNLYYGNKQALFNVNMKIPKGQVTAFIGPSGCGKSTLLRCINRMNDLVEICRIEGEIQLHGHNIYDKSVDVSALRRQVGMVFQRPNPLPKSIYENVVYGLRLQGSMIAAPWTRRPSAPARRGPVGRGEGSPARQRLRPLRRSAAATGDCPCHRHRAGSAAAR